MAGVPACAADPPDRLDALTVSVWLEYDRPGALYIYRGQLPANATLPVQLSFRLPKRSGGPSSTAGIDADGKYVYVRPQLSQDADGILVSYEVAWPRFQIEFYDNTLQAEGAGRRLEFAYRADYAIGELVVEVKEPFGATDFDLDPAADAQRKDEDGLTIHRRSFGGRAAGQQAHWSIAYLKADPRLAAEALSLPTPAAAAYNTAPGPSGRRVPRERMLWGLLITLAVIGLGVVGVVVWVSALRSRRSGLQRGPVGTATRAARRRSLVETSSAPRPKLRLARYCHQCGANLSRGDTFCRQCGTTRRGAEAQAAKGS